LEEDVAPGVVEPLGRVLVGEGFEVRPFSHGANLNYGDDKVRRIVDGILGIGEQARRPATGATGSTHATGPDHARAADHSGARTTDHTRAATHAGAANARAADHARPADHAGGGTTNHSRTTNTGAADHPGATKISQLPELSAGLPA